jgi:16S rRNA (uracil1498-N3)-methyltransferase
MESLRWGGARMVLSLATGATPPAGSDDVLVLSGPEGGLTREEEALALDRRFVPVSLGARVLRAETAPLALLAALTIAI